jgi:plastocyanin
MANRRKSNVFPAAVMLAAVSIGLAGCRPDRAVRSGALIGKGTKAAEPAAPVDKATAGSIEGMVRFKGKAPERLRIDMGQDPVCSITGGINLAEQYVVHNGGLANVYVYVKDGPVEAMNAPAAANQQAVVLDQVGCKYVPHVVAVMKGGAVEFRNSDGTMHNIHTMPVNNAAVDVSQGAKGAPEQRIFNTPEVMMPVRCNNHPWMNAFINVSATPFFAVTDGTGRFDISGLPPGTYTLAAVHEKLGEQTMKLTVAAKAQTAAEFSFTAK